MEHFEELIEMQEGSNDGAEFDESQRPSDVTEIVDVEEESRLVSLSCSLVWSCNIMFKDNGQVKMEQEARVGGSPCTLLIDEAETVKISPKNSPDGSKNDIANNYSAIVQNSGVLRSALLPGYQVLNITSHIYILWLIFVHTHIYIYMYR